MVTSAASPYARRVLTLVAATAVLLAAATCGGNESSVPTAPTTSLAPAASRGSALEEPDSSQVEWSAAATGVLAALSIDPSVFKGGETTRGTVTLHEPAPAGGTAIALASDDTAATVPASVTVAQGATSATFRITSKMVPSDVRIGITASTGGSSMTALMRLTPENAIASLTVSPSTRITAGESATGTVTLSSKAPNGGTVVRLESAIIDAIVPDSITIAANTTSGTFTIQTRDVSKDTEIWITAWVGRDRLEVQIRVVPPRRSSTSDAGSITLGGKID